ncbi:MAG: F0F1 ATP synthase subunit B [Pseudomonadota bacterium]
MGTLSRWLLTATLTLTPAVAWAADAPEGEHAEGIPAEIWLILALVVLIAIAYRPAKKAILGGLDGRADTIRKELDEAQHLREEAKTALANIQRKHRDAMQEAEQITAHAKDEAERMIKQAEEDLAASLKRREAAAFERLAQAEAKAVAEVRATAVEAAVRATASLMGSQLDTAKQGDLIDQAIAELPQRLN